MGSDCDLHTARLLNAPQIPGVRKPGDVTRTTEKTAFRAESPLSVRILTQANPIETRYVSVVCRGSFGFSILAGPNSGRGTSVEKGESVTSENSNLIQALEGNIAGVFLGKPDPIRLAMVALLSEGHLLIEDAPGVGKTLLAKAISKSLHCKFTRLQFTPDMLPSDILGSSVYLGNIGDFEFRKGPIFTNVLLADEINRTTPRTQSALARSDERRTSLGGGSHVHP